VRHTKQLCKAYSKADIPLILLCYDPNKKLVNSLFILHKACITTSCLRPRNPLKPLARRHGWQGCSYAVDQIPKLGRIYIINNGTIVPKTEVMQQWSTAMRFLDVPFTKRGWITDVLACTDQLYNTFSLDEVYHFEDKLVELHQDNHNVRPKIRQQLQKLRDLGLIEFLRPGVYRRLHR